MSEAIGGNAAAVLSEYVDRIVALETEKGELSSDRKEVMKEFKAKGLPKKELLSLIKLNAKTDESDRREARSLQRWAAALLGVPSFYTDDPVEFDEKINEEQAELAKSLTARVVNLDGEMTLLKDSIKDIYSEVKSHGFSVPALKVVVSLKLKDGASQKWDEDMAIVELYRQAVGA